MKEVGVIIGKFYPLHEGHINMIKSASLNLVDDLHVLVCTNSTQTWGNLTPTDRVISLEHSINSDVNLKGNIYIHHMDDSEMPDSVESNEDVSKVWAEYLVERFPDMTMFIGSEPYIKMMAKHQKKNYFQYPRTDISGTLCRTETTKYFSRISPYIRTKLVKRVCVVGAESSGKSTLVRDIRYFLDKDVTSISETARSFMCSNELTEEDFETFALNHYSNVFLRTYNMRNTVQVVDTDLNITKLYAQEYLGHAVQLVDKLQLKEKYDHFIVLAPVVPFHQDGLRIHSEQAKRDEFYEKILDLVKLSGVPYTIIAEEDFRVRHIKASDIIKTLI